MTHITCRLTAKNRDQLQNPTICNWVWVTFTFYISCMAPVSRLSSVTTLNSQAHNDGPGGNYNGSVDHLQWVTFVPGVRLMFNAGIGWYSIPCTSTAPSVNCSINMRDALDSGWKFHTLSMFAILTNQTTSLKGCCHSKQFLFFFAIWFSDYNSKKMQDRHIVPSDKNMWLLWQTS